MSVDKKPPIIPGSAHLNVGRIVPGGMEFLYPGKGLPIEVDEEGRFDVELPEALTDFEEPWQYKNWGPTLMEPLRFKPEDDGE